MTSLLQKMAAMTVMSTVAIAMPVLANPLNSFISIDTKQRSSVLQDFGEVRGIGEFIVLRDSYTSRNATTRQFEAIVDGSRQAWWVDCRRGQLGTDDWSAPRTSSTAEIITFVCNDRYTAGNSRPSGGSVINPNYGNVARVTQETDAVSSNGRSLFSFFEGEQVQVNWGDRRTINGREYVAATDSVGQTGYIRTDRIASRGPTGISGRPIRPSGDRSEIASVLRETPGVSSSGRELFYFFEGEQIQVNWGDRRTINGRDYVAAIDSVGQEGYIQVNQIRGSRSGAVTTRPTRPNREQWQRATVTRETPGISARGEELFFFYEGEQIQINRSVRLRIDGQDHVEALDSVGQRGYIRVDRVR
jgi:hypothetical protein